MNTGPAWATPAGFLFTATEAVSTSIALVAIGQTLTYSISVGALPVGMSLSQYGNITGTPGPVRNKTRYPFVVRAKIPSGVSDRSFYIDVDGKTTPIFSTENTIESEGNLYLKIGPKGENWALNNQYVNFTLVATADPTLTPTDTKFKYFIGDGGGELPPGLSLTTDGVISGFLTDNLSLDTDSSVPKNYRFSVTVTDGVVNTSSYFNILVVDPSIIRYPDPFLPDLDTGILTTSTTYLAPLQFIKGTDLGIVKAQNNIILDVSAYDPYPQDPLVTYYLGSGTTFPPYLTMDHASGNLHGYIPYQPAYTKSYEIEVVAARTVFVSSLGPEDTTVDPETYYSTSTSVLSTNTFSISIKGAVESKISWVSTASLGNIVIGELSELAVVAENSDPNYTLKYRLVSGTLPLGLTLERDGSISGRVVSTATTGTYTINVAVSDTYEMSEIEKTFKLSVSKYNNKKYTEVYYKPFFSTSKRAVYQEFITDQSIFEPNLMYRYFDPNFGVQTDPKMVVEFGLEQLAYEEYFKALQHNFYKKRLYFGDIKSAVAKNSAGTTTYEVVYIEIIDDQMTSSGEFPPQSFVMNGVTYYPGSIGNQRIKLSELTTGTSQVDINEYMMPGYMRTAQPGQYQFLNYITVIPLCYALPGNSSKIISKIKNSGFDFKQFDFEVDRLIVKDSLNTTSTRYLIFGKNSI